MRPYPENTEDINVLADGSLAGTPRVFEVQDADGTPYYFKGYPTYGGTDGESAPGAVKSYADAMVYGSPVVIGFGVNGYRYMAKAYPNATGLSGETADVVNSTVGIQEDRRLYGDVYVAGLLSGGVRYYVKMIGWDRRALSVRICNQCHTVWMEDANMYEEVDRCPHCGVRARPPVWEGKEDPMVGGWV